MNITADIDYIHVFSYTSDCSSLFINDVAWYRCMEMHTSWKKQLGMLKLLLHSLSRMNVDHTSRSSLGHISWSVVLRYSLFVILYAFKHFMGL